MVGNTLLVCALELFAAAHVRMAVGLVRQVAAVVAPVTLPEVGDAQSIPALELRTVVAQPALEHMYRLLVDPSFQNLC